MRFEELGIRTLRQAPANAHGAAEALLQRAGYLGVEGIPTPLGELALERMRRSSASCEELFARLGLDVFSTSAQEWVAESPDGDFEILRCPACGYGAEVSMARHRALEVPQEEMRPVKRVATPDCSTIEDLSAYLHVPKDQTAKAMMYVRPHDGQFVFVVVRGDTRLSTRKLERAVGELQPASTLQITEAGAVPGYASPIGLRGALIVADELIATSANLVCGANETGFHLCNSNYGRDYTADIMGDFTLASPGDACPECGKPLIQKRGRLLADRGGCRYEALLLAVAERHQDERGLCLPLACAPFDAHLIQIPSKTMNTAELADAIYGQLNSSSISVLYDDRDARAGVKFYDADLIGLPVRLTAGERGLRSGMLEFRGRKSPDNTMVAVADVVEAIHTFSEGI
jgi:prolyl-tRNA synthetase